MKKFTCCFTGHRIIPENEIQKIKRRLKKEIKKLIRKGVIYFTCGGALGFDTLAALTVLELQKKYPQIRLMLILPCKNQTKGWSKSNVEIYNGILSQAFRVKYVWETYFEGVMLVRNCCLVNSSSYCITFQTKETGGTAFTVNYAKDRQLKLIMIK